MNHEKGTTSAQHIQRSYELGEDSLSQLCIVAKALYLILYENNCISDNKVREIFEGFTSTITNAGRKTGMSVNCNSCARSIIYKPSQKSLCMYCGQEVTLFDSFDASDLFSFNYLPFASIESGVTEYSVSQKESELDLYIQNRYEYRYAYTGPRNTMPMAARAISKYIYADAQGSAKNSTEMEHELGVNKAQTVQRLLNRFLFGLKSMWQTLSEDDEQMTEALSQSYYSLYTAKKNGEYNNSLSHVICPHCNFKNAPNRLFVITCDNCDKNIDIPLTEGFSAAKYDESDDKYVPLNRLVENIYTLLETILILSQKLCPEVSYAAVSARAQKLYLEKESSTDDQCCPSCHRPTKVTLHNQKCFYCNSPLTKETPGYFFDTMT